MRRCLTVLVFLLMTAPAGAATRYASPAGSGTACTADSRCSLTQAFTSPPAGTEIVIGPGTYGSPTPIVFNDAAAIDVHGEFIGVRRPVINGRLTLDSPGSQLSDVEVVNGGTDNAVVLTGNSGRRVIARTTTAAGNDGCSIGSGTLTDSVCRSRPGGSTGGTNLGGNMRHVTALGGDFGVVVSSGAVLRGTIARGINAADLALAGNPAASATDVAFNSTGGGGMLSSNVGQVTAEPVLRDEAAADYRQASNSPTIDAAPDVDAGVGATDLDLNGNLRKIGAHTDIGAYEHVPSAPALGAPAVGTVTAGTAVVTVPVDGAGGATTTVLNYGLVAGNYTQFGAVHYELGSSGPQNASLEVSGLAPATTYFYRLDSGSDAGNATPVTGSFTTLPAAPTATTGDATNVTTTSATLPGAVDLKQAMSGTARFVIGADLTPVQNVAASGPISATVNGLQPNTTYQYRAQVTTTGGTGQGDVKTFTTLPLPPGATTGDATEIGATSARLAGVADTKGVQGQVSVILDGTAIGEETRFGGPFSVVAAGLAPGSTHTYRLRVITTGGTALGDEKTFTTLPAAPAVTAGDATEITQTTAKLSATTDLKGATTGKLRFVVGPDLTPEQDTTGGAGSAIVTGLAPNTTYSWKARVTTSGGQSESAVKTFLTLPEAPTAVTGDVTDLTTTSARLNGTADTQGVKGQIAMLLDGKAVGEETRFGGPVSIPVDGLEPGSAHTYQLRVTTTAGTVLGEQKSFTNGTGPIPTPTPTATPEPGAVLAVRFRVVEAFVKRRISLQRKSVVAIARCLARPCTVSVTGKLKVDTKRFASLPRPKPLQLAIDGTGKFRLRITTALRKRLYRYLRKHPREDAFLTMKASFTGDDGSRRTRVVRLTVRRPGD